jgi:predicted metal-dependent phosphoesterase TrpH
MQKDNYVDLHVHTSASDGTLGAEAVLILAQKLGLQAIAITAHDTMEGYSSAPKDIIEVVPGIELTSDYEGAKFTCSAISSTPMQSALPKRPPGRERRNRS